MIINQSNVKLKSSHELNEYHNTEEKLVQWFGGEDAMNSAYQEPVSVNLSEETLNKIKNLQNEPVSNEPVQFNPLISNIKDLTLNPKQAASLENERYSFLSEEDKLKIQLIEQLLYIISGKKIKIKVYDPSEETETDYNKQKQDIIDDIRRKIKGNSKADSSEPERVGWGVDYSYTEYHHEVEKTKFSATAKVKTADGKSIDIDLSLNMSREFIQYKNISIKAGDALIDPLVVNYNGSSTDLTDKKFDFDIDMDGKKDQISYLKEGSGFLAYDFNNNGKIDDGSELFGPSSGNGFKELEKHDSDSNGWIDENDQIFEGLRIWTPRENGQNILITLGEAGIGAVYLGRADTQFSLKSDSSNNGIIKETSFYLKEDGSAGYVHELDLLV